jgi:hypothetical protein
MKPLFIFLGFLLHSMNIYADEQHTHDHENKAKDTPALRWNMQGLMSIGTSNVENDILMSLQKGTHDPQKSGFNLQHIGLSVDFMIDSSTKLAVALQANDEEFGLEQLYLKTDHYQPITLKVGYFASAFGRLNADHHGNFWLDYPVINARLLGGEGTRGMGIELAHQLPVNWSSQISFSIQNADDETAISFLGEGHSHGDDDQGHQHINTEEYPFYDGVGGTPIVRTKSSQISDFLYTLRSTQQWQPSSSLTVNWGLSGMMGANRAGKNSKTYLYGTDLTVIIHLTPTNTLTWQSEWMQRHFQVGAYQDDIMTIKNNTLKDSGFYSQLLYQFHPQWKIGLRYDDATGDHALFYGQRTQDELRSDRYRISSLLTWSAWRPLTFHLQHNYDVADFTDKKASTVWLGASWTWGMGHHE